MNTRKSSLTKKELFYGACFRAKTLHDILSAVCKVYMVSEEDVKSCSRAERFLIPRDVFAYVGYSLGYTYEEIGREICRHHSTCINAVRQAEDLIKCNNPIIRGVFSVYDTLELDFYRLLDNHPIC